MSASVRGVYLFCAAPAGTPSPGLDLAGFEAEPIEALSLPPMVLWIQPLRHPPERSPECVVTHHRVVDDAWRRAGAVAPMRFGQWFRDRDALRRALEPRADALAAALERVKGAGEHVVRMDGPDHADEPDPKSVTAGMPGRAHMEALAARARLRRAREERARALAAQLAEHVGDLAREERVEPLHAGGLVSVAHLVDRRQEAAYGDAVEAFVAEHAALRVVRGGPWPPYSFVP